MTRKQGIRCFDLCCGAGALSHGFTSAGATILGGIDNDERALSTARANHPNASWENTSIEDFAKAIRSQPEHVSWGANTLLAGLPCQGFSAAGKRDPGDPRNHLYRHFLRIARLLKPQYVVIENVLGLGAPRNKHVLNRLQVGLRSLGYSVATRILDASNYGVAQRRRRMFVIGVSGGDAEWVFECIKVNGNSPSVRDAFLGLPKNRERPTISHVFMRHGPGVTRMLRTLRPGGPISYRRLRWNERAPTLVAGHRALPVHPDEPRAISVREAARLQGFPDWYVFHGSNSARIEHVANAVPPPLARAVAKGLGAFPDHAERVQGQVFRRLVTLADARLRQQFTTVFRRAFRDRRRRFPWRQVRDPYTILITEVLLQRTNAELAMTVWRDVLRLIPSVTEAANVDLRSLLPLMQRIGIRNRARTIKTLARCLFSMTAL